MESAAFLPLTQHFAHLEDPRVERTRLHLLLDVVVIALCAVIAGAESWDDIALFGETKAAWFASFLALPNGIPSHDTFNRVFAALDPEQFRAGFAAWMQAVAQVVPAQVIALDGKTVRGSHDRAHGKRAIHMVSAWASANRLVLTQVKVEAKANELGAIPQVLRALALSGCIVTLDALGCQREIAQQVLEQQADYVLSLKANQSDLLEEVVDCFTLADADTYVGVRHDWQETLTKQHGRIERRQHTVISDPAHLAWLQAAQHWPGLQALGRVQAERRRLPSPEGEAEAEAPTREVRYYLLSRVLSAQQFGAAVRSHWGIENQVHWVLDVTFGEDQSRIRAGHAAENVVALRHIALNLLRHAPAPGRAKTPSLKAKRLRAGWDTSYLLRVLSAV